MNLEKRPPPDIGFISTPKRKKHKNSKLGCKECKSRRIKCSSNLQLLNNNQYCCLNCLMKWKRGSEDSSNKDFSNICSFSSLSPEEIASLKNEIRDKEVLDYHEMNQQKIYPINNIQIILSKEDVEQQSNLDLNDISIKRGFEIAMVPHNKIEVPTSLKIKRLNETDNQVNSRVALAQLCISGLNFVNETTVSYYTSLAMNYLISKLKTFYISELNDIGIVFDETKIHSKFSFDSNRKEYQRHLPILNSVLTFDEKKSLILRYIKLSQNFLHDKLSLSYKTIRSSLGVIINKRSAISYSILINCHLGTYISKTVELYSLITDGHAMNRYIEHACSSYEICWELNSIFQDNYRSGIKSSFIDPTSINNSTYDYDFKNTINCLGGDNISFFTLAITSINQNYLHMKSLPVTFMEEILKMLVDFGNTFILTTNVDADIDPLLKEDFENLVAFIKQFLTTCMTMDFTKALPLQPKLLWKLTHNFFQIKPRKLLSISLNTDGNAKKLLQFLTNHTQQLPYKYSSKSIIDEYTKNGFLTPIEKVLYLFYIAVDQAFDNVLPTKLFIFDNETYGVCGWNMFTFESIIYDLDLTIDVDKKVLPFANYIFRVSAYMNRRKILYNNYTCLNNFYGNDQKKFEGSEENLLQPCSASRVAHNITEVPISNFLTTTIQKENFFSLDSNHPLPLELLIAFKNNQQQKPEYSFKGSHINADGHYWDGHFYIVTYKDYIQYQHTLCALNEIFQRHLNIYFKNELIFKKLFQQYYEVTGTQFPEFSHYDINILAIENLESVYKFEDKLITESSINSLKNRLMKLKTFLLNLNLYQNMNGSHHIYMDFTKGEINVTDYRLLLSIFLSIDDHKKLPSDSTATPSTSAVNSEFSNSAETLRNRGTESESKSSTSGLPQKDTDYIQKSHYRSMLVSKYGLFLEDYDPLLECTIDEELKNFRTKDSVHGKRNEENKLPEFHFFMPDFNYIKMIRKDKNTLLFNDERV